ncbi:hypothetical protein GCK72_020669 [Caenorhabditis remanei]|uniref:Uncharacterized protein n=1 Tax=Caenorhabditis remanei TaxID=31234 RepID=A0A6A5GHN7_CAERE|nr:hypothetical protein GCK72_020669 [Caenorhabditis remanei]KAF1754111.1 hypothetical protein GCK72_020669 [Caenorhabditis remanei]
MKRTAIREKFDIEKERLERRKVQTRRKTQEILDSALIRKRREIGEFENRISNNVSIEDNFEILEPMSSETIDLHWEPQPSILHFHEFKSSTRAITTMHDSIEEPDDFGEKEKVCEKEKLGSDAHDEIKYRRQVRDTVESVINTSINYSLQNLRNYQYDIDLEQLVYCSNRKFCHLHYRWDDVKAMRQRRREAGLDVENYTIQDVNVRIFEWLVEAHRILQSTTT